MQRKYVFLMLALLVFTSGCAIIEPKDTTNSSLLEPQALVKFSDVPVPTGFKLLPKVSYSFENTGTRVGMLKYQGKASIDQISAFYKEQMAMYKWDLLNIIEYGERQLNFDREAETCVITLTPKGSSVIITIALGPKSQTAPKKAAKPVK